VISERTIRLYEQYPPQPRQGQAQQTLPQLLHEIEVAATFGTPRAELSNQMGLHPDLFDSLVKDSGLELP
jgi:hypothetical protein